MKSYRIGPTTERLEHRAFEAADAEVFFALNSHADVMRFTGEPVMTSPQAAKKAIEEYPDFEEVGFGRWACVHRESKEIVGFCGLKYLSDLDVVDVGYRFFPEFWGRGFGTEACIASLDFGFSTLKLDRIIGLVMPENLASIRVLEKSGMMPDGPVVYDGIRALRYCKYRPPNESG